jgi:hypothetical protein
MMMKRIKSSGATTPWKLKPYAGRQGKMATYLAGHLGNQGWWLKWTAEGQLRQDYERDRRSLLGIGEFWIANCTAPESVSV